METLVTILRLMPLVIQTVRAVEELVPVQGQGKAKLDMVLGVVNDSTQDAQTIAPVVARVVGRIVDLCNATGVFQHGGK
jgi:hypothetical protein